MMPFACLLSTCPLGSFHHMRSWPRGGLPNRLAHAATFASRLTHLSSARFPGRQQFLKAHALEVLLRILFCIVVRRSIAGVAFARDFLEVNFSRTYLLLEPELFHLQMLHFPTSTARQDALDCRRVTVDLYVNVVAELPAELRYSKNFATHLQRSIQFWFRTRQSDTRLNS